MGYTDKLILYYLKANQHISSYWRIFWVYFFNVKEVKIYSNNKTYSVIWRYFFFTQMTHIINFFTYLRNKINIDADKIHITKIDNDGDKTIILEKKGWR